jgi:hypothetical protein
MASWYSLPPERYAATARRDEGNRLLFEMPAMCAVCRSPDAPLLRNILFRYRSSADAGILGTIASAAASEAAADTGLSYSTRPQHNAPSSTVAAGEQFDEALSHLKTPVCTQHTQADDNYGVGNAVSYSKGVLFFASYGYYKAFCALNQIRDAAPPAV